MLALLAQVFAFHAAWGAPPRPPPPPPPALLSPRRAVAEALWYCRDRGLACRTDGARLTFVGLPTPNLFAGGHDFHSKREWVSLQDMDRAVETIVQLARVWGTGE